MRLVDISHPHRLPRWRFAALPAISAAEKLILFQVPTPFSLGRPSLQGILAHLAQVPPDPTKYGPIIFSWPAARLNELLDGCIKVAIETRQITKFDYDYFTETASFNTMGDSEISYNLQKRLRYFLVKAIDELCLVIEGCRPVIEDCLTRNRLRYVDHASNARCPVPGRLQVTGDITFTEVVSERPVLPSLICEIC